MRKISPSIRRKSSMPDGEMLKKFCSIRTDYHISLIDGSLAMIRYLYDDGLGLDKIALFDKLIYIFPKDFAFRILSGKAEDSDYEMAANWLLGFFSDLKSWSRT